MLNSKKKSTWILAVWKGATVSGAMAPTVMSRPFPIYIRTARINKGSSDVLNRLACCLYVRQSSGTDATVCVLHTVQFRWCAINIVFRTIRVNSRSCSLQLELQNYVSVQCPVHDFKKCWHKQQPSNTGVYKFSRNLGTTSKFSRHGDLAPGIFAPPDLTDHPRVVKALLPNQDIVSFYGTRRLFKNGSYPEPLNSIPSQNNILSCLSNKPML
jgi:hypothetical protein